MRDRGMGLWVELDDLPAAPQGVNAEVVGDREQPRLEAVVRVESLQAVVGAQKRLLNKVLDGDLTPRVGIYNASDQPLVSAYKLPSLSRQPPMVTVDVYSILRRVYAFGPGKFPARRPSRST